MANREGTGSPPDLAPRPPGTITRKTTAEFHQFAGPLPPPALLAEYDKVVPTAAERIIRMAEEQGAHRRSMEQQVIAHEITLARRGQISGFTLALIGLIGGFALLAAGKDGYGIAAVITSLATLAGVLVFGRFRREREVREKEEQLRDLRQGGPRGTAE